MTGPGKGAVAGIAAILGGVCWIIKAGAILVTGDQPPVLFEVGPFLFAVGVTGLVGLLPDQRAFLARGALILALAGAIATVGSLLSTRGGTAVASEDVFSPLTFVGFVATILALLLAGIATRRDRTLRPPWHLLPLALFIAFFPLMALGGLLEAIDERLLEVPLLVLGFGWALLGYALLTKRLSSPRR